MMHPLLPPALALLCANVLPRPRRAPTAFLVLALASVSAKPVCDMLLLALFTAHMVDTVVKLQTGTAPAVVFAALAPVDAAFANTELRLLRGVLQTVRAVALVGGVTETLFARNRLLVTANNVVTICLAAWAPAQVTVSFMLLVTVIPGAIVLSVQERGGTATAARVMALWGVFEALAIHDRGHELSISLAAALSL